MTSPSLVYSCIILATAPIVSAQIHEDFNNVPEGAVLTTLPGWAKNGASDSIWTVTSHGGFEGGALEAAEVDKYHLRLDEKGFILDAKKAPYVFRAKIKITAENDAWSDIRLDLLKSGGVHGIGLRFSGGKQAGQGDNSVGLSSGGANWGAIEFSAPKSEWKTGIWYQVEISDLRLGDEGAKAKVTIYPVKEPGSKLVDNQEIESYGKNGVEKLDIIAVSSIGAARSFLIDDIQVEEAKAAK